LKRAIQRLLLDPLAMKLLDGEFKTGDRIQATVEHGQMKFQRAK
jgi:ATP-dependent Clp protease ATP-binding subunit ClpB